VLIKSVVIQGTVQGEIQTLTAVTLTGVQITLGSNPEGGGTPVTNVEALITLTYAPIADTVVTLSFSGTPMPGAGTIITIPGTATVPAGQASVTVPITFTFNPPTSATYQVTLNALVATAVASVGVIGGSPTLGITVVVPLE
jgi:hypothetical protein